MGGIKRFCRTYLFRMVMVALGVSTLCFLAVEYAPGDRALDVALARYGEDVSPQAVEYIRTSEGLQNHPFYRYSFWLGSLIKGDWGRSLVGGERVTLLLTTAFRHTALLGLFALGLSLVMALPLGIYSGCHPGSLVDLCSAGLSGILCSFPPFVTGIVLILLLSIRLQILPVAGFASPIHILLPGITLALGLAAGSCRVTATAILQVRQSPHYAFARHKGLEGRFLFLPHGLRNAAPPVITYLGLQTAGLLDGVVVIETLFAWPGLGNLLLDAVQGGDILLVQGGGLLLGWIYVTVNSLAEYFADHFASQKERGDP